MDGRRLAASGIRWNFVQTVSERLLQTLVFFVVARLIGAEQFGLAAIAVAPAAIFTAVMQAGSQFIVQEKDPDDSVLTAASWFNIALGAVLSVTVFLSSSLIAWLLNHPELASLVMVTSVAPLLAAFGTVPQGILMRRFEFRSLAIRRTAGITVAGLGCVAFAFLGFGAWSMVAQLLLTNAVLSLTAMLLVKPHMGGMKSWSQFAAVGRRTLLLSASTALIQANIRLADIVVGYFAGPAAAGTFRLARTVIDLMTSLVFTPVANILLPLFSRLTEQPRRLLEIFSKSVMAFGMMFSVVAFCVIFGAESFEQIALGPDWPDLGITLALMATVYPSIAISNLSATLLLAKRENHLALASNFAQFIFNTLAVGIGAYLFGPAGSAAFLSLRAYASSGIFVVFLNRKYPELRGKLGPRFYGPVLVGWAIGAVGFAVCYAFTVDAELPMLILISAASLVATLALYGLALWVFFRRSLRQIVTIIPISMRRRRKVLAFLS